MSRSIVAFALLVLVAGGLARAEDCNALRFDGRTLLDLLYTGPQTFGDPRLGTKLGFQNEVELLSYFRFDFGLAPIDEKDNDASRAQARYEMEAKAEMLTMTMGEIHQMAPLTSGGVRFSVDATVMSDGTRYNIDYLAHGHDRSCFHKVRYTYHGSNAAFSSALAERIEARFRELMEALGPTFAN